MNIILKVWWVQNWAKHLKDNYEKCTGLIINIKVSSKEEGKKLWNDWNEVWDIN